MSAGTRASASAKTGPVRAATGMSTGRMVRAATQDGITDRPANGDALRLRDVLVQAVALAHADAEAGHTNADVARRYSTVGRKVVARTVSDYRRVGPPEARDFAAYLLVVSNPYRIEASVRATVKQRAISKLSDTELIERYRDLICHEPSVEAEDRVCDVSRGITWVQRAAASERDAAIDAEKAACEREFAARGLTERDVFDGRSH